MAKGLLTIQAHRLLRASFSKKRIVFLHIPKCGGSSVDAGLREQYRPQFVSRLDTISSHNAARIMGKNTQDIRRCLFFYVLESNRYRYISGHYTYDKLAWERYARTYSFITILRDPVERWYSAYFFNRYKEDEHSRISLSLEKYVRTQRARHSGQNYVYMFTRHMKQTPEEKRSGAPSQERIEEAIWTIQSLHLAGTLEQLDIFERDCKKLFNFNVHFSQENKNPKSKTWQRQHITDEIDAQVREFCAPNRRVYDAVRKRIETRNSWL